MALNFLNNGYFAGKVGIGVEVPTYTLELQVSQPDENPVVYSQFGGNNGVTGNSFLQIGGARGSAASERYSYLQTLDGAGGFRILSLNPSGGNVGIGTTSPTAKLEINGVTVVRGGTYAADIDTKTDVGIVIAENDYIYTADTSSYLRKLIGKSNDIIKIGESGTSLIDGIDLMPGTTGGYVQVFNNSSVAAKFVDGKLGIGTTSPDSLLEISSDSVTDFLKLTTTGGGATPIKLIFEKSTSEQGIIEYNRNGDLEIYNTDADGGVMIDGSASEGADLYVANTGNVGIGTTNPSQKLTVEGNIELGTGGYIYGDTTTSYLRLNNAAGSLLGYSNAYIGLGPSFVYNVGGSEKFRIASSTGNVGIGTTNPTAKLHVVGTGNFTGLVSGITPVAAANFVTKAYVDGGGGAGSGFLPLAGGTMLGNITMGTNRLNFGSSAELKIYNDGSDNYLENTSGDMYIMQRADNANISFQCDNGAGGDAEYFRIDGQYEVNRFLKNARFNDNVKANFGTGDDLQIYHNGTTGNNNIDNIGGDLYISQYANDKDIIFRSDDGSGGNATYFKLDGSLVNGTTTLGAVNFPDKSKLFFGNDSDLRIYHDGSNSYITDAGTGNLRIRSTSLRLENTDSSNMIVANGGGDVAIYYNGSAKFATTTTGVNVTGTAKATAIEIESAVPSILFDETDVTANWRNRVQSGGYRIQYASDGTTFVDYLTLGASANTIEKETTFKGDVVVDGASITIDTDTAGSSLTWKESDSSTTAGQLRGYANRGDIYLYDSGVKKTELSSQADSFIPALHIGGTSAATGGVLQVTGNAAISGKATSAATITSDGSSTLTTKGYVNSLITGATIYRGTWDPDVSLNSGYGNPNLNTVTQTSGYYYICSADGAATPNGATTEPNSWNTGDWVIWNDDLGASGQWQKIDNSSVLSGVGTGQTVALWEGDGSVTDSETLGNAPITVSGSDTTFSGNVTIDRSTDGSLIFESSGASKFLVGYDSSPTGFRVYNYVASETALFIDATNSNATFAGNITTNTGILDLNISSTNVGIEVKSTTAGSYIRFDDGANANRWYLGVESGNFGIYNNANDKPFQIDSSKNATFTGNVTIGDNSASEIFLAFNSSATDFALGANGSNFMIGTSSDLDTGNLITLSGITGNFGIGTTGPGAKLHVDNSAASLALHVSRNGGGAVTNAATIVSGAAVYINGNESGGSDALRIGSMDNSTGDYYIDVSNYAGTASYDLILQPFLGNVGIGTTSPDARFDVADRVEIDTYAAQATGNNAFISGYLRIIAGAKTGWGVDDELGKIEFYGEDTSGVGARTAASIIAVCENGNGTSTTTFSSGLAFYTSPYNAAQEERMRITAAGGISFGSTGTAYGTSGQVLTSAGNASPTWTTPTTGTVTGSGAVNQVAFWDGSSSLSGNNKLYWDDTNGCLGINDTTPSSRLRVAGGASDTSIYTVDISHVRDNPNVGTHAMRLNVSLSGADNTTADRLSSGLLVDIDSSANGDASNEHRIYGVNSSVNFTGFTDLARGGYFLAESNYTGAKTSQLIGVFGNAVHDVDDVAGGVSNMMGVYGTSSIQDKGDVDNAYGGFFNVVIPDSRTETVGTTIGVQGEVEINKSTALTYGTMIGVSSLIDNNETTFPIFGSQYLFKGDYQGTKGANAYGIYTEGDKNYFEGNIGIGAANPTSRLSVGGNGITTKIATATIADTTAGASLTLRGGSPTIYFDRTGTDPENKILMDSAGLEFKTGTLDAEGDVDFKIKPAGKLLVPAYTQGFLQSDADGNIDISGGGTLPGGPYLPLDGGTMNNDASVNMNSGQLTSVDFIDFGIGQLNGESTSNLVLKSLGDITYNVDSNNNGNSSHIFQESGSELMRIRYDGNVGIGVTSPLSKLTIDAPVGNFANGTNAISLNYDGGSSPGDVGGGIVFSQEWWSGSAGQQVTGGIYGIKNAANGTFGGGLAFYTQPSSAANMAQRMIIDTSGAVLIGGQPKIDTATKLQVGSNDSGVTSIWSNADDVVFEHNTNLGLTFATPNDAAATIAFADPQSVQAGWIQYLHDVDAMRFGTNGNNERIRITSAGNVGIGDTGPAVKLQVSTNSPTNNVAALIGDGWVGNSSYHKEGGLLLVSGTSQDATQTGAGIAFQTRNTQNTNYWKSSMIMDRDGAIRFTLGGAGTVAGSEDFTILSGGNVGIGTTSPVNKLNVNGDIGYIGVIGQGSIYGNTGNSSYANMQLYNPATGYSTFNNQSYGYYFLTGGSTKLAILNNGNVGIGVTNPGNKLRVEGSVRINDSGDGQIFFGTGGLNKIELDGTDMKLSSGGLAPTITMSNQGLIKFGLYGLSGQGTPANLLGVDGSGNVVKTNSFNLRLDDTPAASTTSGSGNIVNWSVSETVTAGTLYAVKTNGGWTAADADSEQKSTYMLAIALGSNATAGMLLQGFFYKSSHGFTIGAPLYVSNTLGSFSNSRPTGSGDYVRIIGYATSANYIYFDPDKTWVKIA